MLERLLLGICLFSVFNMSFGQVSPPGLGEAKTASWIATALRQDLDSSGVWQSVSYIGLGRKSNPDQYNPIKKPAIFVVNQEFYHQFMTDWQYSVALSYRRQQKYGRTAPYSLKPGATEQEFRLYGRLSYKYQLGKVKITPTLRQEFRKYYDTRFMGVGTNFQLRSRFRIQASVNLDKDKRQKIMLSSEQLFSASKKNEPQHWTPFQYQESRFMMYYSFKPKGRSVTYNIGYMNNWVRNSKESFDAHYVAFDVTFDQLFSRKK